MHLVVARHTLSGVIEHQAGAADARRVLGRYGGGAADYPDPLLACRRGQEILDRPFSLGLGELHLVGLVAADEVEVLRQRHELRAGGDRGGDQARGRAQVGLELGCRNHLDRRHPGLRHGDTDSLAGGMAASLLTLGSLQLPVIEKSCAMRRGSACRLMSEISLPMPGSISRNWPSSALILSSPERVALSSVSGSPSQFTEPSSFALPPSTRSR